MSIFFKTLYSDFKRMFLSWKLYAAILGVAAITFISIFPEVTASGYQCSVYYLVNARGGLGAFLTVFAVLIVLPYSLSYWEEAKNGYVYYLEYRSGTAAYCWSHVLTAAAGAFLAVVLGYILCFGILAVKLPLIRSDELEMMRQYGGENAFGAYVSMILSYPMVSYFLAVFSTEAMGYSFLAAFTLAVSVKVENVFLLFSMPVMLYYGSILVCSVLGLPGIFRWYYIMKSGGCFLGMFGGICEVILCVAFYFGCLIFLAGVAFLFSIKKRRMHG